MIESLRKSFVALSKKDLTVAEGFWTEIILNPEDKILYTFATNGAILERVYHGIDLVIGTVYNDYIQDDIESALLAIEKELEDVISCYLGSSWDGRNYIGCWQSSSNSEEDGIATYQISPDTLKFNYWIDPDEWFDEDSLEEKWRSGMTIEEIIDSEDIDIEGDDCCDRDEAIAWLTEKVKEWE